MTSQKRNVETSDELFDEFGPEKIVQVYDPKTKMRGIIVIDNTALGPAKGGIRMTPTVNVHEVFRLARTMTWKNALANLPFGGGKSGIIAQPNSLAEKKRMVEAFAKKTKLSPKEYIAAPDINMAEQEMTWFVKAHGSLKSATGKPKSLGGIPHEYGSTGFGVAQATLVALKKAGIPVEEASIAIEGYGNVGAFAAKHLATAGASVIAVSDSGGALYHQKGLRPEALLKTKQDRRTVTAHKEGKRIPHAKLFELEVDVLIPAALPDVIHSINADKVKAAIIVSGANIAMQHATEEYLHNKGKLIVPDFVANAGGVISSYAEHKGMDKDRMFSLVKKKIRENTQQVLHHAARKSISPKQAGMEIAKKRVTAAMKKRKR